MRRNVIGVILAGFCMFLPAYAQTVTVSLTAVSLHLGTFYQFTAKVTGTTPTTTGWTIALPAGATGSPGTISANGRYTPPNAMPSTGTVIVTVASTAVPTVTASATVTLLNPYPTLASVSPANVAVGPFTLTMNGSDFVPGAQVLFGGVPLPTTYVSATRLTATGTASAAQSGNQISVAVVNPNPGSATSVDVVSVLVGSPATGDKVTLNVAARFLDQAAFGPDAASIAQVQALLGLQGYVERAIHRAHFALSGPQHHQLRPGPGAGTFFHECRTWSGSASAASGVRAGRNHGRLRGRG